MNKPLTRAATLRPAGTADAARIAELWHASWQATHAALLPPAVAAFRGPAYFALRGAELVARAQVAERAGVLVGFTAWREGEVDELFVAEGEYGQGTAAALLAWAEATLVRRGVETAALLCGLGNERAARFYEKHGWRRGDASPFVLDSVAGPMTVETWRMTKRITAQEAC